MQQYLRVHKMKTFTIQTTAPLTLSAAIEQLYAVFSRYNAPVGLLDVCTHCCMDPALEKEMRRLPLRQISTNHFYAYNDSAKNSVQPADEIKYFVPRLCELLASGADLHHSTELVLQRMGNCPRAEFSATERATIDAFALAFFANGLAQYPSQRDGLFMGENALSILLMMDIGGIDLSPLLAYWLEADEPAATMHYAQASYWDFWPSQEISNAFSCDRLEFCATVKDWMLSVPHRRSFARNLLALDAQQFEPEKTCACCNPIKPSDIVEAVFDWVAC
jgi:hypothetical protein